MAGPSKPDDAPQAGDFDQALGNVIATIQADTTNRSLQEKIDAALISLGLGGREDIREAATHYQQVAEAGEDPARTTVRTLEDLASN